MASEGARVYIQREGGRAIYTEREGEKQREILFSPAVSCVAHRAHVRRWCAFVTRTIWRRRGTRLYIYRERELYIQRGKGKERERDPPFIHRSVCLQGPRSQVVCLRHASIYRERELYTERETEGER